MMNKQAYSSVNEEDLAVRLLTPGKMVKTAGMLPVVEEFIGTLRPDPRYLYTLVNAMGDSWYYGDNSNADYYGYNPHLGINGLVHDPDSAGRGKEYEGWQCDPTVQQRLAKSWSYGYPCFYGATVYAHHKNTDPVTLGFGDVVLSTFNPNMKRVELVLRTDVKRALDKGHGAILERVGRGERVDVSMGARVPFDLCSICTDWEMVRKAMLSYDPKKHKSPGVPILLYHRTVKPIRGLAVTRHDYCEHMLKQKRKVLEDGRKVFVYNDFPAFFDISFVWVGADKTARVMWFLGSNGSTPQSASLKLDTLLKTAEEGMDKTASDTSEAEKTAEIEKKIRGGLVRKVDLCVSNELDLPMGPMASLTKTFGLKTLLSTLAGLGISAKPHEFHALVGMSRPLHHKIAAMAEEHGLTFKTDMAAGFDYTYGINADHFDEKCAAELLPFVADRSIFSPHLDARVNQTNKVASAGRRQLIDAAYVSEIAALYNGYRASLLKEAGVLNKSLTAFQKTSGLGVLPLSADGVVHWVTAHQNTDNLDAEIMTAMKYATAGEVTRKLQSIGTELTKAARHEQNYINAFRAAVKDAL